MADTYDFILVGGGTSGCVLASRLAHSPSTPKVLLIEAGGPNDNPDFRSVENRWAIAFAEPSVNWGYQSVPQKQLSGQQISLPRGKGLGGSSAINFSCWVIGSSSDFNFWSSLVDDESWNWDGPNGVKERFRKIENLHTDTITSSQEKYLDHSQLSEHSKSGNVDVSYNGIWSELENLILDAGSEMDVLNKDGNSGNPVGFGLLPSTFYDGKRVTSATAYLSSPPSNLTILTSALVSKILFDSTKRATGVQTNSGQVFAAKKEVILSAGAFDSPKLLLLSGVGPKEEIEKHGIKLVHELPGVGQTLKDHYYFPLIAVLKEKAPTPQPPFTVTKDPKFDTGPQAPMGWLSSPAILASPEFDNLPQNWQDHIKQPNVPTQEIVFSGSTHGLDLPRPDAEVIRINSAVMNSQSVGTVTLSSSNPADAPLINVNYLAHPYDRRVAIEAVRSGLEFSKTSKMKEVIESHLIWPASENEEDILEFCKSVVQPVYHHAGSCRMGKEGDEEAVVDKEFKVRGVSGLRVVDHSVAPIMVNNHTMSTCFLIGETAAEKIIQEYGL
ncbi:glucose-methanol-choline oxidoreductase-like protein [Tricladium varicosporioides]|nr:glucose-methanol-choline oxidoreductase-like protein [Hymenoscyphus varicosporioides]